MSQIYTIITPGHGLVGHFEECIQRMQLHVPAALLIMGELSSEYVSSSLSYSSEDVIVIWGYF